ncbi:MAG: hypothetical protein Q4D71_06920, partial [Oscillospiraceae bacterium]|nr:hypothetical protein [Oscillospiraceae bacterium]
MEDKRNYGIDCLRILCMIMVACHHILYHGGILERAIHFPGSYQAAWALNIGVYCAVNVYGMISGYVGHAERYLYRRTIPSNYC